VFDELIWNEAKALFVTDENLEMLNHEFDSQKNKALNKAFTKVAPRNMVFSKMHSLYDRLALVIACDSIGLYECLTCIFQMLLQNEALFYLLLKLHGQNSRISSVRKKENAHQSTKD